MSMIELKAVTKSYNGRRVVDAMSMTVEKGERTILFGPSGCGKTTVLNLIAGLAVPESGEILIDDRVVAADGKNLHEAEGRGIGMVFQDLALWPHMTVAENVEFGLKARRTPSHERRQRIKDIIELVGLGDYLKVRPGELSGGEQQRVALARALVLAPRIVLMDEPLSSLDDLLKTKMEQEILRLHRELDFTLIYVTHSREEAAQLGTRTIYMTKGKIQPTEAQLPLSDR
jgi:ABC-type sugar transport system ATPase subunit